MNKIWHFSDTHTFHDRLTIPEGIDIAIFSGDCSNPQYLPENESQVRNFIKWYANLNIPKKIFVAGNHDLSIEAGYINKYDFTDKGIIYLENESTEVNGLKIWGSPCTPTFGSGWAWNVNRDKLGDLWETIPDDTNIIISHGPSYGDLDLAKRYVYNPKYGGWFEDGQENCGCVALKERVLKIKPKLVCFGHIHTNNEFKNAGTKIENGVLYSNGAVLEDRKFQNGPINNGNVFEI